MDSNNMYKPVFEWATRNNLGDIAAPLARFFDDEGHTVNNDSVWRKADEWMLKNTPDLGLRFADAAQHYSNWLKEATTNRW